MKITIKDIAKQAGVSTATVSRVLNGNGNVDAHTCSIVNEIVRTTGFVLNQSARRLRSNKSGLIGVIVSDLLSSYDIEIIKGIQSITRPAGYNTIICDCDNVKNERRDETEKEYLKILYEGSADGIILIHSHLSANDFKTLHDSGHKLSVLGVDCEHIGIPSIVVDNVSGAYKAVSHLCSHGYTRIAFIYGRQQIDEKLWRVNGYRKALKENNLAVDESFMKCGRFTEEGGYEAFTELMHQNNKPDAIFCSNDDMAVGAFKAAKKLGVRIPEDVAVIGYDDIHICQLTNPALTSVRQPKHEIGTLLAERMLQSIADKTNEIQWSCIKLEPELIIRESCGC